MTCDLNNEWAFLHIPKTGGSFVYQVLQNAGLVYRRCGHEHNWTHGSRRAFCIIRHPVDWWLSMWCHQVDHHWPTYDGQHPVYGVNRLGALPAEEWLRRAADLNGFYSEMLAKFVANSEVYLRTATLNCDLMSFSYRNGWNLKLIPRVNVEKTKTPPISEYTRNALLSAESEALKIWQRSGLTAIPSYEI